MADLSLKLIADMSSAIKGVESFTKATNESVASISKGFSTLGKVAAASIAAFATGALIAGLKETVDAAAESQVAINELGNSLKAAGNFSQSAVSELKAFADQLQATTIFEDDAIIKNIAFLESLTKLDKDGLKRATQAAIDFAAATGTNLETAFTAVAKSASGNMIAFQKLGVEIRKGKTDAETLENTINALNAQFGGRATAQTDTYSGALAQLGNIFGNLKEEIGNIIVNNPAVIAGIKSLSGVLIEMTEFLAKNSLEISNLVSVLVNKFAPALDGIKILVLALFDPLKALELFFLRNVTAILEFIQPLKATDGLLGALNRTLSELIPNLKQKFTEGLSDGFKKISATAKDANVDTSDFIKEFKSALKNPGTNNVKKVIEKTSEQLKAAEDAAKKLKDEFNALSKSVRFAGLDEIQVLKQTFQERLALIDKAKRAGVVSAQETSALISQVTIDYVKKTNDFVAKENEKANKKKEEDAKKLAERISELSSGNAAQIGKELTAGGGISGVIDISAIGASIVKAVSKGAEGASQAVTGIITVAATAAFGPIGQVVGQVVEILAQSPEKLRESINAFFKEIPVIISNIVSNIPNLLNALLQGIKSLILTIFRGDFLVNLVMTFLDGAKQFVFTLISELPFLIAEIVRNIPRIIEGLALAVSTFAILLAEQAPVFIESLAQQMPNLIPALVSTFTNPVVIASVAIALVKAAIQLIPVFAKLPTIFVIELVKQVPNIVTAFINSLITDGVPAFAGAIKDAILNLVPGRNIVSKQLESPQQSQPQGGSGGGSNIFSGIFGKIFGFAEGGLVPSGFPNDSFPARLTSGELVIDRSISGRLQNYLDRQESGEDNGVMLQLLASIDSKIGGGVINLQIGERVLTTTIREAIKSGRVVFA